MSYPDITLTQCDYAQITQNKTGDLAMVYKPLLNLVKNTTLGNFTTENLKFDRYNAQDMVIVDEFDGSTNIIVNDDHNTPRLINSGFAVQEDNTFLIPEHYTNSVTNIYEDKKFDLDTQLLKLYNKIPTLKFLGFGDGGFKCGSYVFYFRLADSVGNMSNIIQHSSAIQIFVGERDSYAIRMGMEDELANKSVMFELSGLDSGFDYIRVFYERTSSGNDLANTTLFYMIDLNFPIINGKCELTLTGLEAIIETTLLDLKNEYADIASCKTLTIVDNTLFLANIQANKHEYDELLHIAWCIYPTIGEESALLPDTNAEGQPVGYYDPLQVYSKVGYWPDEYYRLGIVFIYDNNQLSPVFNIQGYDMNSISDFDNLENILLKKDNIYDLPQVEPDNYLFNSHYKSNSKGVIRTPNMPEIGRNLYLLFNLRSLERYIQYTSDLTDKEKEAYDNDGTYDVAKFLQLRHGIKGFFFVRQKRIPTTLAQGIVIGLTTKEHGCLPILKDGENWKTKSFLSTSRFLSKEGKTISTESKFGDDLRVVTQALLVPDAELQEATFNQIFTSQEFALYPCVNTSFAVSADDNWWEYSSSNSQISRDAQLVKLTAVPKDVKLKTNGTDYFSTVAGSAEEAFKTADLCKVWDQTYPQDLTWSDTLLRGRWGYFVGMSSNNFQFGDIVSIKKSGFIKNKSEQNLLEFLTRFSDYSFYSPISTRYNVSRLTTNTTFKEFGGDCYPSMFTHRMMANFIDPELPTNTEIVNPRCWRDNYLVRCTAVIEESTYSNIGKGANDGFFIDDSSDNNYNGYANEVTQTFELDIDANMPDPSQDNNVTAATFDNISFVSAKEQELDSTGLNLKALFKTEGELHGIAQINRADVNAVSFGQWITFPIRSSLNLALRDVDFSLATEEAKFNKKRGFYPLEPMDITNKLPESNVINGAAKKTVHKNAYPGYKTVPFMKQEFFNRIYWSKPNVSDTFLNSFRMVYRDLYKEYNKEFGNITKILPLGNSLFICFDHGMGLVPIDRSIKTESEASPYLASRNVLPAQITTLSKDYGSMWKNSIIQTPNNLIYGVDTVAKKIWRTNGENVEFISDHYVTKFLNDFIDLSEFDHHAYQGHIDVKTHYNNFKRDVIFTLVKDTPLYKVPSGKVLEKLKSYFRETYNVNKQDSISINLSDPNKITFLFGHADAPLPTVYTSYIKQDDESYLLTGYDDNENTLRNVKCAQLQQKSGEIQSGKIYIDDIFTGVWCEVESWEKGTVWSLCYNEALNKWITFYDWYPVESCNVDNIYFSFDQELIDKVYDLTDTLIYKPNINQTSLTSNKYFIDRTFTDKVDIYRKNDGESLELNCELTGDELFLSFYWKALNSDLFKIEGGSSVLEKSPFCLNNWNFAVYKVTGNVIINFTGLVDFCEVKFFKLHDNLKWDTDGNEKGYAALLTDRAPHLKYCEIRDFNPNRMLLWKHGLAGLYDNQGKVKPTHWYGKQHEFNFEFVVNDTPVRQKVFNNLKILSNKAAPAKLEYEIVGEGYEWFDYKPIITWINKKAIEEKPDNPDYDKWFKLVLYKSSDQTLYTDYPDFPDLFDKTRIIKKLPYIKLKHTDKKGTPERPHYEWDGGTDKWGGSPHNKSNQLYTYNCSEPCLIEDDQLNEVRLRTESLANDVRKYGRIRGNMQYLEDLWDIEIRPINFEWCYLTPNTQSQPGIKKAIAPIISIELILSTYRLEFKKITESRHRDKYIKIKVRYSGEDLALVLLIYTIFEESFA